MPVLKGLYAEHRLFQRLLDTLEEWVRSDADFAPTRTERTLLTLLDALDKHERIEHEIFEQVEVPGTPGVRKLRKLAEDQHAELEELKEEIRFILENDTEDLQASIKPLILQLAQKLRRHFDDEEKAVWPEVLGENSKRPPLKNKKIEEELAQRQRELEHALETLAV